MLGGPAPARAGPSQRLRVSGSPSGLEAEGAGADGTASAGESGLHGLRRSLRSHRTLLQGHEPQRGTNRGHVWNRHDSDTHGSQRPRANTDTARKDDTESRRLGRSCPTTEGAAEHARL